MVGPWQIVLLIVVILLLFGATKLPSLARNAGRSARIFKSEMREMKNENTPEVEKSAQPSEADRIANDYSTDPVEPVERVDPTKKNEL